VAFCLFRKAGSRIFVIRVTPRRAARRYHAGMDETRIKQKPTCPDCGRTMQLVQAIPGWIIVPELPTYGCRRCAGTPRQEPGEDGLADSPNASSRRD
jgi:hypothetical protein